MSEIEVTMDCEKCKAYQYERGRADRTKEFQKQFDMMYADKLEQVRADERARVLEEISKEVAFEEKWLFDAIREDKGNYEYNIDIAFSGIKSKLNKFKEQGND